MLRILKDCRLCGVSVHAGECYPIIDFDEPDIQILIGAGFAERFKPVVKTQGKHVEDTEAVKTDKDTSSAKTAAKTTRKRKK